MHSGLEGADPQIVSLTFTILSSSRQYLSTGTITSASAPIGTDVFLKTVPFISVISNRKS